jgi:hypothetical protein
MNRTLVPLGFMLRKNLSFGMVADDPDVDEAAQVELLRSKHRHLDCASNEDRVGIDARDECSCI